MFFNNISLEEIFYRIPAIFIGFTFHEFMHAYVADKLGDPTPRSQGRLTINPLVHIDWIGFLVLLVAGFGWAKPVHTNPNNYKNYKKGRILVSLAGPLANLALAFVGLCILYFGYSFLINSEFWYYLLLEFIWINVILFAFNLIPVPPLDGFTLVEMWIKPSQYQKISKIRPYGLFIIIALSLIGVLGMYLNFVFSIIQKASFWLFSGIDKVIGLF